MTLTTLAGRLGCLLLLAAPALAAPLAPPPAEQFVEACTSHLSLDQEQRAVLLDYLEQEVNFMAVQRANHTEAELAELLPSQREELQRVAGRIMSPTQLRRFRELEATPKMRDFLRKMDLEK